MKWLLFMLRAIAIFELHQATICKAIDMKMFFFSHGNRTHFHNKGFAHSLVLKVRVFGTQNAPFKTSGSHLARLCSKENFREPLGLPSI